MNVVLVAEESAGIGALRLLAQSRHRVVAVLASDSRAGVRACTVAGAARQLGVPVWSAELVREADFATTLRDATVDVLLNVHSLLIVNAAVVAAPAVGSFNVHPGPLPRYAGLNAPSWAILEGEREHAVTLHRMEPSIDTGAIAYEHRFEIEDRDTGLTVALKCIRNGLPLIARLLEDAARDEVPVRAQDLAQRRYFDARPPYGGRLPWTLPARRVVDLVRAADYRPFRSPWGHPSTTLKTRELRVVEASRTGQWTAQPPGTVRSVDGRVARVAAADEWVLVRRVQRSDATVIDAGDVLGGGARLS